MYTLAEFFFFLLFYFVHSYFTLVLLGFIHAAFLAIPSPCVPMCTMCSVFGSVSTFRNWLCLGNIFV